MLLTKRKSMSIPKSFSSLVAWNIPAYTDPLFTWTSTDSPIRHDARYNNLSWEETAQLPDLLPITEPKQKELGIFFLKKVKIKLVRRTKLTCSCYSARIWFSRLWFTLQPRPTFSFTSSTAKSISSGFWGHYLLQIHHQQKKPST